MDAIRVSFDEKGCQVSGQVHGISVPYGNSMHIPEHFPLSRRTISYDVHSYLLMGLVVEANWDFAFFCNRGFRLFLYSSNNYMRQALKRVTHDVSFQFIRSSSKDTLHEHK